MTSPAHPEPAPQAGVAGLAREIDTLRRQVVELEPVAERVEQLARLVGQLSEALAAVTARRRVPAAPSWLMAPTDPDDTHRLLAELCAWLEMVLLRYPDTVQVLPECWLWHPDVVEELLWLMHAWTAAYQGPGASVGAAAEWHERHRPGVTARIKARAGGCSVERHQTRPGWTAPTAGPAAVPGRDNVEVIARWWAVDRDHAPPEPEFSPGAAGPGDRRWQQ